MSHQYRAVAWNRQKRIYDLTLIGGVGMYLVLFAVLNLGLYPQITAETLIIRASGTAALLLLHVILSIGPLCRLDARFLPLLYNRRHMGVTMFLLAAVHGGFSLIQFHALGNVSPIASLFLSNTHYDSLSRFPFQPLGFIALLVLFLMAATSHDFWLANLTPPVWKSLHMLVYVAYALIVMHVALGVLQAETSPVLAGVLGFGLAWTAGLHFASGLRERTLDRKQGAANGLVDVCSVDEIGENLARVFCLAGERVAVFKYDGAVSAISNICQHQNGPLGEGCIIDGLVTCPWHGFQYDPADGAAPPPFKEAVPTFNVHIQRGRVLVDPVPNPPGTRVEPARIQESSRTA